MATYEATGRLLEDFGTQQVTEKFRKREFVLEIPDGQYPQLVKFQLAQDKCDLLDNFQQGAELLVTFNLRGRSYDKNGQTMYFTSLDAWKIQPAGAAGGAPQGGGQMAQPQQRTANTNTGYQRQGAPAGGNAGNAAAHIASEVDNDLPF